MARLFVLTGPDVGKSFTLAPGASAGRDALNELVLRDPSISRKHARFECNEGRWRVLDTGSRNGVHHAGRRVEALELEDGVEFQLGEVVLRFRGDEVKDAGAAAPAASGAGAPAPTASRSVAPAPEPDEIVLEGEWSDAPAPAPRPPSASAPARELERTQLSPIRPPTASPAAGPPAVSSRAPAAATRGPAAATRGPAVATRAPVSGQGGAAAARGLLQYSKVVERGGFAERDLAQQPWWIKGLIGVAALAVFALVFWLAFSGTSFFKGKLAGEAEPAAVEEPETR